MSASPPVVAPAANTKRPLDDESSPSGLTDQPDAKRPALDKPAKDLSTEVDRATTKSASPVENDAVPAPGTADVDTDVTTLRNGDALNQPEISVDGASVPAPATTSESDAQPIQSTGGHYDRSTSQQPSQHGHQDETGWLHMRAVISSAEAATVIGKGGENVSLVRRHSGAKCTVSDYSRGAVERVLTVSGAVDAVAKVCTS